ncbi:MAG: type I restriction-modification system endonuclease, partial [Pseudomonadota bacterium]
MKGSAQPVSLNFDFLAAYEAQLVRLGAQAERYFGDDPNGSLLKMRQFGELLAQQTAARLGALPDAAVTQHELLQILRRDRVVPEEVLTLLHGLRQFGNEAAHDHLDDRSAALQALKIARQAGIWFHKTFGRPPHFKAGPFVPPPTPVDPSEALAEELESLRQAHADALAAAASLEERAELEAQSRLLAEQEAERLRHDLHALEALATEAEDARVSVERQLRDLQASATPSTTAVVSEAARTAAAAIDLDEAATRALIDRQLRARGWQADSQRLTFTNGARPTKNQNLAIAEWPTASGPADYALFAGTTCVGVVEAKRRRRSVPAALQEQAHRYARGFTPSPETALPVGSPWAGFKIPFAFAANGRPYLKQLETASGIWFRDCRLASNLARALTDWPTPEGLLGQLDVDRAAAQAELQATPFDFGFPLRDYQQRAIQAVEAALDDDGKRAMLLAMATGTGKTKLAIALLYRLLTANRFRRICFVVDRNLLGEQAAGEFTTTKVMGGKAFAEIFNLKRLADTAPETETRIHICTIQGLVRRVLYATDPADVPPIDQYDLLVVDECHRGYLLDRELSETELSFRSEADYISKYRRVLEHFDAVKVGLTATPALHTTEIFGEPIFRYSYREAVVDGWLIDHEPPIRIETKLSRDGIVWQQGDEIELLDTRTGAVDLAHAPDELSFDVGDFNRKVITEPFVRVVAAQLAQHIDLADPGKTLVFAVNNDHADMIVAALKQAFAPFGVEDAAIAKITGTVDKPLGLTRSFRNDANPKIAVTVDLLTTGVDVPKITNLVFLRRVNSRILYEQMLGRATRRADEIHKETFRIFDAVDLYANLQALTEMKPVAADPKLQPSQLVEELAAATDPAVQDHVREQLIVKMARRLKRLSDATRQSFEAIAGETPEAALQRLRRSSGAEASAWLRDRTGIGPLLDGQRNGDAPNWLPVSHHPDEHVQTTRGYGAAAKPEDFLDGFTAFVRDNRNKIAALAVVVTRPQDLTRAQLKELRLALDREGYSEANLRRAWHDARNEDVAASIVGFVRQAALGDPLVAYAER